MQRFHQERGPQKSHTLTVPGAPGRLVAGCATIPPACAAHVPACVTAAIAPHAAAAAAPDDDIGSESVDVLGLGCPSEGDDLSDDDSDDAH